MYHYGELNFLERVILGTCARWQSLLLPSLVRAKGWSSSRRSCRLSRKLLSSRQQVIFSAVMPPPPAVGWGDTHAQVEIYAERGAPRDHNLGAKHAGATKGRIYQTRRRVVTQSSLAKSLRFQIYTCPMKPAKHNPHRCGKRPALCVESTPGMSSTLFRLPRQGRRTLA